MARVLLVSANQEQDPDPVFPLGAAYVAGAARSAGHEVAVYDCCFAGAAALDELRATIRSASPDVIGMSLRNVDDVVISGGRDYLPWYRNLAAAIRDECPTALFVLGGAGFSLFPEVFAELLGADLGVVGEGENVFPRILDRIEHFRAQRGSSSRVLWPGDPISLNANCAPARDLFDLNRYAHEGGCANIQTKRGCPLRCTYCTYPLLEGHMVRLRDPGLVGDEAVELCSMGIDSLFFVDSVFNAPAAHAMAVCDALIERRVSAKWTAYVSPGGLSSALVAKMARAGCRSVELGVDSLSDGVLASLKKDFSAVEALSAVRMFKQNGIKVSLSLIFGAPGETWESMRETVERAVAAEPSAVIGMIGVRLYPGTDLARRAVASNHVRKEDIGLAPIFWASREVEDGIENYLQGLLGSHDNWFVPGLSKPMTPRLRQAFRAKGVRGPLWELLS